MSDDVGPVYTSGIGFRARAEARQREYRTRVLKVGYSKWGHFLDTESADGGRNFIRPEIFAAARKRSDGGKGVARRTFENMLSSQAMCFNIFAPLAADLDLASKVLGPALDVATVQSIAIEHTPDNAIFGDQTGRGGVDCDVMIEATAHDGARVLLTIETKFVEPEFSTCGFREPKRIADGRDYCTDDVAVSADESRCLYASKKRYAYWQRAREHATLAGDKLPIAGCPFAGPEWQLWVNHTLAHAEATRRGADRAVFIVCAPDANKPLLGGQVLDRFGARLADPSTFRFLPLDELLARVRDATEETSGARREWCEGLTARYAAI